MRRSLLALALLAACKGDAAPAGDDDEHRPPAQVTCRAIAATTVDDVVDVTGVIAPPPKLDATISSPVAGRVTTVAVEEGDRVAAGALLAVVEDPALPASSAEARAQAASARAAKEAADAELARQQRLVDTGVGARRELDEARARVAATQAEVDAAAARLGLADRQLARRELRAPHAGVVLHVWKRVGESVDGTATTPVAEVADTRTLEVRAQVTPRALLRLREGLAASVRVNGLDGELAARVVRVPPAVDAITLLGTVRLELAPRGADAPALPIGTAAGARIVIASHPGVVVPEAALRRSITGGDELVACEGGVARVRAVTTGTRAHGTVEIATGLAAGERVVVDHALGLDDGQALADGSGGR